MHESITELSTREHCVIVCPVESWACSPNSYYLPPETPKVGPVDILKTNCAAGKLQGGNLRCGDFKSHANNNFDANFKDLYYQIGFRNNIRTKFNHLLELMHASGKNYTVIHWRRGDQLETRCKNGDHSFNCVDVKEFLHMIDSITRPLMVIQTPIYIATNEMDKEIHRVLNQSSLYTMNSFKNIININNSFEEFLVDLMMMCKARYLFLGGYSTIHRWLESCRHKAKLLDSTYFGNQSYSSVKNHTLQF
jgi:hypothetical protein